MLLTRGSKDDEMYSVFISLQYSPTRKADVSRAWSRDSASLMFSDVIARSSALSRSVIMYIAQDASDFFSSGVQLESLLTVLVK